MRSIDVESDDSLSGSDDDWESETIVKIEGPFFDKFLFSEAELCFTAVTSPDSSSFNVINGKCLIIFGTGFGFLRLSFFACHFQICLPSTYEIKKLLSDW